MMSKSKTVKLAATYAEQGFLCSEAVLLALSRYLNVSSDLIPRIATGFGAGIGRAGEVCGALAGGVMALGLRFGRIKVNDEATERPVYWFATELATRFLAQWGNLRCQDLLELDISDEEDRQKYQEQRLWETRCRDFITATTSLAYDLLQKE